MFRCFVVVVSDSCEMCHMSHLIHVMHTYGHPCLDFTHLVIPPCGGVNTLLSVIGVAWSGV